MRTPYTLTLALVALVAAAPAAQAKAPKQSKVAEYTVHMSGSQVQTWENYKPDDEDDACDLAVESFGSQTIKFRTLKKGGKLTALEVTRNHPFFKDTGGRPYLFAQARMFADANREGEYRTAGSTANCEGPNGGGVVDRPEQPQDCGERDGLVDLRATAHDDDENDLFVPLLTKDHVQLSTTVVGYGTTPGSLDAEYANCPDWVGGPHSDEWDDGRLATTVERIPYKKLLSPKTKQIVVNGGDVTCFDSSGTVKCGNEVGEFKGRLVIAYKLVLKRKK